MNQHLRAGLLAALCLAHAPFLLNAEQVIDWNAGMDKPAVRVEYVGMNNQPETMPAPEKISGEAAIVLDGQHALRFPCRLRYEQTIYVKMRMAPTPGGVVFSRNRPEDGMRGLRLGLASNKESNYDGFRGSLLASAGDRKTLTWLFDRKLPEVQPGKVYEWIVRFKPEELLQLDIIDSATGQHIASATGNCPKIPMLAEKAGERYLYCGGERKNSREMTTTLPAGSAIMAVKVWDFALSNDDLSRLCGVKLAAAPQPVMETPPLPVRELYLNAAAGSDAADGLSAATAFKSLGKAVSMLKAGDTLHIAPGVYFGPVEIKATGTPEHPICIVGHPEADQPVVITSADRELREGKRQWELVDSKLQLYRIKFPHLPARILYSGTDLLPYPSVEHLKKFQFLDEYPGNPHGFAYDESEGMLYVRLRADGKYGSADPNAHVMAVAPANAAGYNGHHIWKLEHANLLFPSQEPIWTEISNVTFETPGAAAIITRGDHLTVRNVRFDGCRFGVWGISRPKAEKYPANVVLDGCYYHHFPAFDDMVEIIKQYRNTPVAAKHQFFWWQRKGTQADRAVMKNYETGIAGGIGRDWIVRNCRFENVFEGFSAWGNSNSVNLIVENNLFHKVVDNAVEAENHAANLIIRNNRFIDVFEPVSWQPLDGTPWPGPVFVYNNLFVQTPAVKDLWPWKPGAFKIGASTRNWTIPRMGGLKKNEMVGTVSKRFVAAPGEGFVAYNNTIYYPYGYFMTLPHATSGPEKCELANFRFMNNLIWVDTFAKESFDGSLMEFDHNVALVSRPFANQKKLPAGHDGITVANAAELDFIAPDKGDFQLKPNSRWRNWLMKRVALPRFNPLPGCSDSMAVIPGSPAEN